MHMFNKNYNKIIPFALILFFMLLFSYRDFLVNYRSMLLIDHFPYYRYQDHIIYLLTGDKTYQDQLPMSSRFLGIFLQYLIYKVFPCLSLTNVDLVGQHDLFKCTTFSLALLNYISKYSFILILFLYVKIKLKRSLVESFLSLILAFIFIEYVENFTFDRLTLLYIVIILYFLDKPILSNSLIFFSFLVNEKVLMLLGPLFFLRFIFLKEDYKNLAFSILGVTMYFIMIFFLTNFLNYEFSKIYNNSGFYRILLNISDKSHISNSIIPISFCLLPYILSLIIKNKLNHKYTNFEIIIPFILWFLAYGGGENNIGRYVMHSMPLWIPILSSQIIYFLKIRNLINNEN